MQLSIHDAIHQLCTSRAHRNKYCPAYTCIYSTLSLQCVYLSISWCMSCNIQTCTHGSIPCRCFGLLISPGKDVKNSEMNLLDNMVGCSCTFCLIGIGLPNNWISHLGWFPLGFVENFHNCTYLYYYDNLLQHVCKLALRYTCVCAWHTMICLQVKCIMTLYVGYALHLNSSIRV